MVQSSHTSKAQFSPLARSTWPAPSPVDASGKTSEGWYETTSDQPPVNQENSNTIKYSVNQAFTGISLLALKSYLPETPYMRFCTLYALAVLDWKFFTLEAPFSLTHLQSVLLHPKFKGRVYPMLTLEPRKSRGGPPSHQQPAHDKKESICVVNTEAQPHKQDWRLREETTKHLDVQTGKQPKCLCCISIVILAKFCIVVLHAPHFVTSLT